MSLTKSYKTITLKLAEVKLQGHLLVPKKAQGIVLFSHGSGSSRYSVRNNYVAEILQKAGFATLLFDLLTEEEDKVYENRFNIGLITERLLEVTDWINAYPATAGLPVGYFGASTGAASALKVAAIKGNNISAVVSRGGRPDLAMTVLSKVKAPTLLIVGELDYTVLGLNIQAFDAMKCPRALEIIPKATHLFPESGALEKVATVSATWFKKYL